MRQVVLTAPKQIEFREVAAPEAGNLKSDEVLLRILRIGICGSEIHSYHGQHPATFYPVVQGHEYSAEVVAVGSAVRKVKPGRPRDGASAARLRRVQPLQARAV